jgi:Flp pilus assembly protein TadG
MVTVETAMVLPLLVLFALVGVVMIGLAQARLQCADAAGQAARQLARGDPSEAARLASVVAGRPVRLSSTRSGPDTVVTLRAELHPLHWLAAVAISESATVATEPTAIAEPVSPP